MGPSIKDVGNECRGGRGQKSGGFKNPENMPTSFMDGPILVLKLFIYTHLLRNTFLRTRHFLSKTSFLINMLLCDWPEGCLVCLRSLRHELIQGI